MTINNQGHGNYIWWSNNLLCDPANAQVQYGIDSKIIDVQLGTYCDHSQCIGCPLSNLAIQVHDNDVCVGDLEIFNEYFNPNGPPVLNHPDVRNDSYY